MWPSSKKRSQSWRKARKSSFKDDTRRDVNWDSDESSGKGVGHGRSKRRRHAILEADGTAIKAAFTYTVDPLDPFTYTFTSTSTNPNGNPILLEWIFADGSGTTGTASTITHTFPHVPGSWDVILVATDSVDPTKTDMLTETISVDPGLALALAPVLAFTYDYQGDCDAEDINASTLIDGTLAPHLLTWTLDASNTTDATGVRFGDLAPGLVTVTWEVETEEGTFTVEGITPDTDSTTSLGIGPVKITVTATDTRVPPGQGNSTTSTAETVVKQPKQTFTLLASQVPERAGDFLVTDVSQGDTDVDADTVVYTFLRHTIGNDPVEGVTVRIGTPTNKHVIKDAPGHNFTFVVPLQYDATPVPLGFGPAEQWGVVAVSSYKGVCSETTVRIFDQVPYPPSTVEGAFEFCYPGPKMVKFRNTTSASSNTTITGHLWDFGDGNNAVTYDAEHTYSFVPGSAQFDVTLLASGISIGPTGNLVPTTSDAFTARVGPRDNVTPPTANFTIEHDAVPGGGTGGFRIGSQNSTSQNSTIDQYRYTFYNASEGVNPLERVNILWKGVEVSEIVLPQGDGKFADARFVLDNSEDFRPRGNWLVRMEIVDVLRACAEAEESIQFSTDAPQDPVAAFTYEVTEVPPPGVTPQAAGEPAVTYVLLRDASTYFLPASSAQPGDVQWEAVAPSTLTAGFSTTLTGYTAMYVLEQDGDMTEMELTVKLTVTDSLGNSNTITEPIVLGENPVGTFSYTIDSNATMPINFFPGYPLATRVNLTAAGQTLFTAPATGIREYIWTVRNTNDSLLVTPLEGTVTEELIFTNDTQEPTATVDLQVVDNLGNLSNVHTRDIVFGRPLAVIDVKEIFVNDPNPNPYNGLTAYVFEAKRSIPNTAPNVEDTLTYLWEISDVGGYAPINPPDTDTGTDATFIRHFEASFAAGDVRLTVTDPLGIDDVATVRIDALRLGGSGGGDSLPPGGELTGDRSTPGTEEITLTGTEVFPPGTTFVWGGLPPGTTTAPDGMSVDVPTLLVTEPTVVTMTITDPATGDERVLLHLIHPDPARAGVTTASTTTKATTPTTADGTIHVVTTVDMGDTPATIQSLQTTVTDAAGSELESATLLEPASLLPAAQAELEAGTYVPFNDVTTALPGPHTVTSTMLTSDGGTVVNSEVVEVGVVAQTKPTVTHLSAYIDPVTFEMVVDYEFELSNWSTPLRDQGTNIQIRYNVNTTPGTPSYYTVHSFTDNYTPGVRHQKRIHPFYYYANENNIEDPMDPTFLLRNTTIIDDDLTMGIKLTVIDENNKNDKANTWMPEWGGGPMVKPPYVAPVPPAAPVITAASVTHTVPVGGMGTPDTPGGPVITYLTAVQDPATFELVVDYEFQLNGDPLVLDNPAASYYQIRNSYADAVSNPNQGVFVANFLLPPGQDQTNTRYQTRVAAPYIYGQLTSGLPSIGSIGDPLFIDRNNSININANGLGVTMYIEDTAGLTDTENTWQAFLEYDLTATDADGTVDLSGTRATQTSGQVAIPGIETWAGLPAGLPVNLPVGTYTVDFDVIDDTGLRSAPFPVTFVVPPLPTKIPYVAQVAPVITAATMVATRVPGQPEITVAYDITATDANGDETIDWTTMEFANSSATSNPQTLLFFNDHASGAPNVNTGTYTSPAGGGVVVGGLYTYYVTVRDTTGLLSNIFTVAFTVPTEPLPPVITAVSAVATRTGGPGSNDVTLALDITATDANGDETINWGVTVLDADPGNPGTIPFFAETYDHTPPVTNAVTDIVTVEEDGVFTATATVYDDTGLPSAPFTFSFTIPPVVPLAPAPTAALALTYNGTSLSGIVVVHNITVDTTGTADADLFTWEWIGGPPSGQTPWVSYETDPTHPDFPAFTMEASAVVGSHTLQLTATNTTTGDVATAQASFTAVDLPPAFLSTPGVSWFDPPVDATGPTGAALDAATHVAFTLTNARVTDPEQGSNVKHYWHWKDQNSNPFTITGDPTWDLGDSSLAVDDPLGPSLGSPIPVNFAIASGVRGTMAGVHVLQMNAVDVAGQTATIDIPIDFANAPPAP